MSDHAIRNTSEDALAAKIAAVRAGYLKDPFLAQLPPPSRTVQPLIKRGTHARVCCVDRAVSTFMKLVKQETSEPLVPQVILLGAGKDTLYLRYRAGLLLGEVTSTVKTIWMEIDHLTIIQDKANTLRASSTQKHVPGKVQSLRGDCYTFTSEESPCYLLSYDLRQDPQQLLRLIHTHVQQFNTSAPTLILSECVQMYLPHDAALQLFTCLVTTLQRPFLISYEPILGNDPFGKVMEDNLRRAHIASDDSCLVQHRTLADWLHMHRNAGWTNLVGCDMASAYETIVTDQQRKHANRCEFLDELEEWLLIMRHYGFVVAQKELPKRVGLGSFAVVSKDVVSPVGFHAAKCVVIQSK